MGGTLRHRHAGAGHRRQHRHLRTGLGFLLRPFPFDESDCLVRLRSIATGAGQAGTDMSAPDLQDYLSRVDASVELEIIPFAA
jgi:hypothetical protein